MKRILTFAFLCLVFPSGLLAQGVGVNTDGSAPDGSAILDVKASDKGLLVPRVSLTDVTSASPITAPASGLLVYNTNASVTGGSGVGFYVWLGSGWTRLDMSNSGDWRLTGNSGTSPATNYLGTSDATDLSIRTNATERIRVTSSGTVRLNSYTTNNVIKTSGGDGTLTVGAVNLASSEVTGVLPVANGGTGVNSIPANGVVLGNGTSPITTVAPGAAGNVLMSDGTTWTSNDGSGQFIRNQNSADQTANFRITGTGRANTSFQSPLYTRADAGTVAIRPNTNSTTAIQLQNAGGTSILNVDATNSRVGIGTTAPTRPLQVSATGVQQIAAVHPSNVDNTEPAEVFFDRSAVASTQVAAVGMSGTARDFFIWVNGADRVTITETGNVGIGTTAPAYLLDVADRMRVRTGGSGSAGIWYNNMDNSGLVAFTGTMDNNLWGIWGLGINDWHFRFNRNSGNMSAGPVNPSATVGHPKLTVTRDGMAACCGGEDATLALADNTQSTGRRASISFHNGGEAEGVVRLIQNTINGVTSRRLQLYDNQSSGLGLEIGGSGGVVGRFWYGLSGSRTERRDNAGLQGNAGAQSGMFETDNPTNYPSGASSWWHLLDVRHSNPANNYAMQFAGSFYDQRFFARKTNNNASEPWNELVTAGRNSFWTLSGNYSHSVDDWCTGCSGTGNLPDLSDDATQTVSLPFNVVINGTTYNQVSICSNGWIAFGSTSATNFGNTALPATFTTLPVIFPYWDDLRDYGGGEWVRWGTVGTSPNRVFIVDYNMRVWGGSDRVNFMVLVHETTNHIVVKYRDAMSPSMNGQSATIGFQMDGGANAKNYPIVFNGKVLDDNRDDAEGWSICPIR